MTRTPAIPALRRMCLLAPALGLLLAGCAAQHVQLCGGRIHNSSGRALHDIRIVHQPTQQMVANNLLAAGGDMDLLFTDLAMQATAATIEWTDPVVGPRRTTLELPRAGGAGGPQRLVYEIDGAGEATVRLLPCR